MAPRASLAAGARKARAPRGRRACGRRPGRSGATLGWRPSPRPEARAWGGGARAGRGLRGGRGLARQEHWADELEPYTDGDAFRSAYEDLDRLRERLTARTAELDKLMVRTVAPLVATLEALQQVPIDRAALDGHPTASEAASEAASDAASDATPASSPAARRRPRDLPRSSSAASSSVRAPPAPAPASRARRHPARWGVTRAGGAGGGRAGGGGGGAVAWARARPRPRSLLRNVGDAVVRVRAQRER